MKLRGIVWGVDLLLLATGVLLAVQIAGALSTGRRALHTAAPDVSSEGPSGALPRPPDPQVIVERNPFAPLRGVATGVAPQAPQEPPEELEETELPLVLVGTVAAEDPVLSQAAVRNARSGETQVVGVGDALAPEATALRIERRRLILMESGGRRELRIEEWDPDAKRERARGNRARVRRVVEKYRKYYASKDGR